MATTHLKSKAHFYEIREEQARQLSARFNSWVESGTPCILCGDFNDEPHSETIKMFQGEKV